MPESLTLDEIELLLASTKQRGVIKPILTSWFESGEMTLNMSEQMPGKEAASLRNSVNIRLKQDFPDKEVRLTIVGEKPNQVVLLINMPVYLAAKAASAQETDEESGTDED